MEKRECGNIKPQVGAAAGFNDAAAASAVVSEGIVHALRAGNFHLIHDTMARQFEGAYQGFSDNVVMPDFTE